MTGEAPVTKIGDTVYLFDINHRVYKRNADGRATGGPVYREHFRPFVIQGEDKRSWLVVSQGHTWQQRLAKSKFITAEQMDERIWLNDHRYKLNRLLNNCSDVDTLKAVADVLNYPAP